MVKSYSVYSIYCYDTINNITCIISESININDHFLLVTSHSNTIYTLYSHDVVVSLGCETPGSLIEGRMTKYRYITNRRV